MYYIFADKQKYGIDKNYQDKRKMGEILNDI